MLKSALFGHAQLMAQQRTEGKNLFTLVLIQSRRSSL